VWQDTWWRLSCVTQGPIPGFARLEPRRHIPFITELDGPEAATLGTVLGRVTRALREAADAEKVYVYVFGNHVPHLRRPPARPQQRQPAPLPGTCSMGTSAVPAELRARAAPGEAHLSIAVRSWGSR
jgi:hypothetical protein